MTIERIAVLTWVALFIIWHSGCTGSSQDNRSESPRYVHSDVRQLASVIPVANLEEVGSPNAPSTFISDMRLIHTPEGFAWRTVNVADENPCAMCRAGTPLVLENRPRLTAGQADVCDADVAGLRGDITALFSLILSPSKEVRDAAISSLTSWLGEGHDRLVHALINHPRPEVRGSALELAGMAQLNMFMPELSRACRLEDGPEKRGAVRGAHHLNSLGGKALATEFALSEEEKLPKPIAPEGLDAQCPPTTAYRPVDSDRSVGSIAMGAFEHGLAGRSGEPTLETAPPFVQFAFEAGFAAYRREKESLQRHIQLLKSLLERANTCLVHPCDWQLLEAMETSLLSLSDTTR